jgi:hypothetical protein
MEQKNLIQRKLVTVKSSAQNAAIAPPIECPTTII